MTRRGSWGCCMPASGVGPGFPFGLAGFILGGRNPSHWQGSPSKACSCSAGQRMLVPPLHGCSKHVRPRHAWRCVFAGAFPGACEWHMLGASFSDSACAGLMNEAETCTLRLTCAGPAGLQTYSLADHLMLASVLGKGRPLSQLIQNTDNSVVFRPCLPLTCHGRVLWDDDAACRFSAACWLI